MLVDSPSPYLHNIEFIGDSITCGYGNEDMDPPLHDGDRVRYSAYGAIAARNTKAAAHIIAWSGKGAAKNCCGDTSELMPELYRRTIPQDSASQWDFTSWIADAVVINLGTNDFNSNVDVTAFGDAYQALIRRSARTTQTQPSTAWAATSSEPPRPRPSRTSSKGFGRSGEAPRFPGPDPEDGFGCDYHPSAATHAKLGALLTGVLQQDLGW